MLQHFKQFGFGILALCLAPSLALAESLTIQGRVLDSAGNPVNGSGTIFRVQIMANDASRCVLFDESHTVDLSSTNGLFTVNLNDGLGTRSAPTTYTLERALSNRQAFSVDASYCASGSGTITYSPASDSNRKVKILFRDPGAMASFETIPEMDLNPVAFALEARTVGGFSASSLLRVLDSGVPGAAPSLTSAQFTDLQALIAGTSPNYMRSGSGSTSGARLPTYAGNPSSPQAGSIWFDTSSGSVKYSPDGTAVQTIGVGGGSGTITSVTAGGALTGGGTSGAVTVSLPTTGVTGFGSAVGSATSVPVITYDSYGRLTAVTTAAISGTLPSGTNGEFLKYSSGAWGSAAVRMSDIKNATGAAALFGSTTCSASETFYWDSGTDQFKCQSIALGAPSSTVAATYTKVTVAADGRVNGGSATLGNADIADLAWSKLTGVPNLVANGGSATSIVANSSGSKPSGQTAGRIYVDIANQKISYDDGTAWVDVSGSASATPSVSVTAPLTSTSGTVGITQATTSTNGYLSSTDWNTFSSKLSSTLSSARIWVGNGSNAATAVAPSGNLSLDNAGKFTVTGIRDQAISAAGTNVGQVLRYSSANTWAPEFITMKDLRSTVTGSQALTASCPSDKTMYWDSATDSLGCQNISIAAGSQITGQLPIANGGTGTNSAGQNLVFAGPASSGAGAPAFRSLTSADLPATANLWATDGTDIFRNTGKVGIGTTSPSVGMHLKATNYNNTTHPFNFNLEDAGPSAVGAGGGFVFSGNDGVYTDRWLSGVHGGKENATPGDYAGFLALHTRSNGAGSIAERMRIDSNGQVGIGTTVPNHRLHVAGNIGLDASSYLNFGTNDGGSGYGIRDNGGTLEYKNSSGSWAALGGGGASQWVSGTGNISYSGGNVGIGTTTVPNKLTLDVGQDDGVLLSQGGITYGKFMRADSGGTQLMLYQSGTAKFVFDSRAGASSYINGSNLGLNTTSPASTIGVNGNVSIGTYAGSTAAPANGLTVSGSVGLGTSAPSAKLEVDSGTANTSGVKITRLTSSTPTSTGQAIGVDASGNIVTVASGGGGGSSSGTAGYIQFSGGSGAFSSDSTANAQLFWDSTNHRLGIGTTSPSVPVDVMGDVKTSTAFYAPNAYLTYVKTQSNSAGTPGYSFVYSSDSGMYEADTAGSKTLGFSTSGLERMRIASGGNIGIGSNNPGQKLTVAGTIESTSGGVKFPDGTVQTSANPTATSATATMPATVNLTGANGAYQDLGFSITLPAAGTYMITGDIRADIQGTSSGNWVHAKLYNSTAGADVAGSNTLIIYTDSANLSVQSTASVHLVVTVTAASSLKLYGARTCTGGSCSSAYIASDSNGYTRLSYMKLAN